MRIACLQFAPQVGDVDNNLNRADSVLSRANPKDLDLLVLPELAFSGYNFKSLHHISPFLEPTAAGITSLWARTTALKYNCMVTVGYPEKVDVNSKWPTSPEYYNSAITVNKDGETIVNYRKSFLYYTDETWALEGPDGFFAGKIDGVGNVAMGICMDLNPYKFEAPWTAWEFSYHVLHRKANLVVLSMAWLTREDPRAYSRAPKEPDMDTLSYWLSRLEPIIRAETVGEIIVVLANRTGTEDDATYAGTSAVLGIQDGEVKVYGILGRGERDLLVVDTGKKPQARLVSEPNSAASNTSYVSPTVSSFFTEANRHSDITVYTNLTTPAYSKFDGISRTHTDDSSLSKHNAINTDYSNSTTPIDASSPVMTETALQRQRKSSLVDSRRSSRTRRKKVLKQAQRSSSDEDERSSSIDAVAGDDELDGTSRKPGKETHAALGAQAQSKTSRRGPNLPIDTKPLSEAVLEPSNRYASPRSEYAETPIYAESPLYPAHLSPNLRQHITKPSTAPIPDFVGHQIQDGNTSDTHANENTSQVVEVAENMEQSHPLSALVIPESYQTTGTTSSFGPRSDHTPLRPKSNMW